MSKAAPTQAEFPIATGPTDLRRLPLPKVRALRDTLEAELLAKLTAHGLRHCADSLDTICRCASEADEAHITFLESVPRNARRKLRTLRALAQFAHALERRACQRRPVTA